MDSNPKELNDTEFGWMIEGLRLAGGNYSTYAEYRIRCRKLARTPETFEAWLHEQPPEVKTRLFTLDMYYPDEPHSRARKNIRKHHQTSFQVRKTIENVFIGDTVAYLSTGMVARVEVRLEDPN